jgi:hypothetical protein
MRPFLVLGLVLATATVSAPQGSVRGLVYEDRNGNGERDGAEPGLAGVVVSDQIQAVATGPDGAFSLGSGYGVVFVSVPSGYRVTSGFWREVSEGPITFGLSPIEEPDGFAFIHASDTHVSEASLHRMQRFKEITAAREPDFVLVTGDLIEDALRVPEPEAQSHFELYTREIANFPVPVWSAPGNHDFFGIERFRSLVAPTHPLYGKKMYRKFLGPNYYSFNFGNVHFIALDTVQIEDQWYYGGVDEEQLAWLEQDLSFVPADATIVTFHHIPLLSARPSTWGFYKTGWDRTLIEIDGENIHRHTVSNLTDVLSRFEGRRYILALGGHIHARERIWYETAGNQIRF